MLLSSRLLMLFRNSEGRGRGMGEWKVDTRVHLLEEGKECGHGLMYLYFYDRD
jgi:hypothetical protein